MQLYNYHSTVKVIIYVKIQYGIVFLDYSQEVVDEA